MMTRNTFSTMQTKVTKTQKKGNIEGARPESKGKEGLQKERVRSEPIQKDERIGIDSCPVKVKFV